MRLRHGWRWLSVVMILDLGISIWWGVSQYRLQRALGVRMENNYQRAFHELVWHIQTIENELAKLTAATAQQQQIEKLATVWRQTYAAQEKIGQLPLGLVPLDQAESYLTSLGDYVFALVRQDSLLAEADRQQVDKLQQGAAALGSELMALQSAILQRDLKWTEVEKALIGADNSDAVRDNTVINSLQLVNRKVQEYPEIEFDQRMGLLKPDPVLPGPVVSQAVAQERALQFLSPENKAAYQLVAAELTGGSLPVYNFVFTTPQADRRINVAVTQNLGRVIWMLDGRLPKAATLSGKNLTGQAERWLEQRGFRNMQLVGRYEYQATVLFAYVYQQDGVLIYPDLVRVRVARDDGSIIGFEGNGYTVYHQEKRQLPSPGIAVEAVMSQLAAGLELIGPTELAIIFNERAEETLVYELPVRRGEHRFLVYVDAQDGAELQIVRLEPTALPQTAAAIP